MTKPSPSPNSLPISVKNLIRILVIIIILISLLAGFYHSAYKIEQKRYLQLEDKYTRVRQQLGKEKMQELIDQSYQIEVNN
jgi:uncharacterized protein YxeA